MKNHRGFDRKFDRRSSKVFVAAALAIALVTGAGVLVAVAATLVAPESTGTDTASAFHQVAIVPANASELANWMPDNWHGERVIEPGTRTLVAAAYIRAWAAMGRYETAGDTTEILDTFSGPARAAALAIARDGHSATWDLHHCLSLEFYARDGATVAFTDGGASVVRTMGSGASETVLLSHETYSVVMVFEDGYWRVRQLQRAKVTDPVVVSTSLTGLTAVTGSIGTHSPISAPASVVATEYRPASWSAAGTGRLRRDFARAKALGFTALRVPLPFATFGNGTPSASAIRSLKTLLAIAAANDLKIEPVLLADLNDFSPASWVAADAQVTAIVAGTAGSPALGIWDLADRPDLRTDGGTSRTEIRAFLIQLAAVVRASGGSAPITISFSAASEAIDPAMLGIVDVVSVDLAGPSAVNASIDALERNRLHRSLMLTVADLSTEGGWSPLPHTEARQETDVAGILLAALKSGVTRVSIASLEDSAGASHQGLLRPDGSTKPAAALLAHPASLGTIGQPGPLDYLGSKFWLTALATALLLALVVVHLARIVRHRVVEGPESAELFLQPEPPSQPGCFEAAQP